MLTLYLRLHIKKVYVSHLMTVNADGPLHVGTNMSVGVHTRYLNVFERCQPPINNSLRGTFFLKAATPVIVEKMLPWLHLYPRGFHKGFLIPQCTGSGFTMVNN